jgi:hypothetical protein
LAATPGSVLLLNCNTRDLSLDGVFVETGGEVLPQDSFVDVGFLVYCDGEIRRPRLPARIVRVQRDGLGLSFRYPDYNNYAALVDLLYGR